MHALIVTGLASCLALQVEILRELHRKPVSKPAPRTFRKTSSPTYSALPAATGSSSDVEIAEPFNVAGKPRRTPWNLRRKELVQSSRTNREKLMQFKEVS